MALDCRAMSNPTIVLAVLAGLVFLGMGLEEVFRRTGIPDVLILLMLGLAASMTGLVDVSRLDGADRIFTTCALVLILFEGAVRLRLSQLRAALGGSTALTLISFAATALLVGILGWALFGMRPLAALLLGCILGGTSSAVVIPMVQAMKMEQTTRTVLTLESALSDVLCIVATLALTTALTAGDMDAATMGRDLAYGFVGALIVGIAAGFAWSVWLRNVRKMRPSMLTVAAAVFLVFAAAETLGMFGAISCLAFGIVLGNADVLAPRKIRKSGEVALMEGEKFFLSEAAFILKVFFFVYLGASLQLSGYEPLVFGGLTTIAVFAVRPFTVRASMRSSNTPRRDAIIASVLAPKGLAAAVLATVPLQAGVLEGPLIKSITFGVILFSIIIASLLTLFMERPFVANAYLRLFRRYGSSTPEGAEVATAEAGSPAEVARLPEPGAAPEAAPAEAAAPDVAADRATG